MSIEPKDPALAILRDGKLALQGEFMWGSNYTFLLGVEQPDGNVKAVYKPNRGVRPLWDFASPTLARREVAAISSAKLWVGTWSHRPFTAKLVPWDGTYRSLQMPLLKDISAD